MMYLHNNIHKDAYSYYTHLYPYWEHTHKGLVDLYP